MAVTGSSCQLTGLPEGQAQHFEVTAIYRGLDGGEIGRPCTDQRHPHVRGTADSPAAGARPRCGGRRARVAWTPVDHSEVRILRSDVPPPWQFGTWVSQEEMTQFGPEVTGRLVSGRGETVIEAELSPGVHHLVPFSIGGTGIVMGRPAAVGITDPVRHLAVTPFATHATVSWEWPPTAQLAEVTWEVDGDADYFVIGQAEYRSQGGARVPLGRGTCKVEVRAVIMADGDSFRSPPVRAEVDSARTPGQVHGLGRRAWARSAAAQRRSPSPPTRGARACASRWWRFPAG